MKLSLPLIAKKEKCNITTDYRPISLATIIYKLIAKTMAKRLKETLPHTVSDFQMAFVKGRQITNVILNS